MNITLCFSVPDHGEKFIALASQAAARLASKKNTIDIHYTCHSREQQLRIEHEKLTLPVSRVHIVAREPNTYAHSNSVTHSRCVNALFHGADSDIAIICDYDGAIVAPNWDEILVNYLIDRKVAFLGSPYSDAFFFPTKVGKANIYGCKYQKKPNCIFLAYEPRRIKALSSDLCDFADRFGSPDALPVKLISNPSESNIYCLPVGSFVSLDTGSHVPEMIETHHLSYQSLLRSTHAYQVLSFNAEAFDDESKPNTLLFPEEYLLDDRPLFAHYRKGFRKSEKQNYQIGYSPDDFMRDIERHLDLLSPR